MTKSNTDRVDRVDRALFLRLLLFAAAGFPLPGLSVTPPATSAPPFLPPQVRAARQRPDLEASQSFPFSISHAPGANHTTRGALAELPPAKEKPSPRRGPHREEGRAEERVVSR
ncbi:hypothetical protein Droror1_Dr00025356 [Drosera rotundifolia]